MKTEPKDLRLEKDLSLSISMACIVLVPAMLFSLKSDLPHVFAITALILSYSILKGKAVIFGDRPVIYFLVVSASLAVFMDMAIPMNDSRTGILDIAIRSSLSAPALLYMAAFATLFRQGPMSLGVASALSISVMIVGGDLFRGAISAPERIFFAKPLTDRFSQLYMLCVALEVFAIIGSLRLAGRYASHGAQKASMAARDSIRALCLILLPILAVAGTLLFYANEKSVRKLEQLLYVGEIFRKSSQESLPFPDEADIGKALPKEDPRRSARIVARVKAKSPPGLLRARCYAKYSEGRWNEPELNAVQLQGAREADALSSLLFLLPSASDASQQGKQLRLEVFQSTAFSHTLLLAPPNSNSIELVADKLSVSRNGLIEPSNWKPDAGFTAFVDRIDQNAAYRAPLSPASHPEYLDFPEGLKGVLSEISSQAEELALKSRFKGDLALVESVAAVLRNRCQYSLDVKDTPKGRDPVDYFLSSARKGHCELFASSAVLTLRSMGIPSRYVTGLVCDETHPSGTYFVARIGGAHAWCEAYLRDEGRWVQVEATPAAAFESLKPAWGLFDALSDWIAQSFRQSIAWLQRGYFAQAILELLGDAALMLWSLASSRLGIGIEALLVLSGAAFLLRWLLKRKRLAAAAPESLRLIREEFLRLESAASSRSGLRRGSASTVREWAFQAKASCGERLLELALRYESLRYRQSPPQADAADAFIRESKAFRKSL